MATATAGTARRRRRLALDGPLAAPRGSSRRALHALALVAAAIAALAHSRAARADEAAAAATLSAALASSEEGPREPPPSPFVVRRIANPRWRPPASAALALAPAPGGRPRALDHVASQLFRYEGPSGPPSSHWQLTAGEQGRDEDALELFTAASRTLGATELEALRLAGRRGQLCGALGDQLPLQLPPLVSLQRLRGGLLHVGSEVTGGTAFGGVPTPVPGQARAPIQVAGVALQGMRYDAPFTLAGAWFARGTGVGDAPGRGGVGSLGWKAPLRAGTLAGSLAAQAHDLDGEPSVALAQGLAWELTSRRLAALLATERATTGMRLLGTDRIAPAPRAEDRWSLQARSSSGRAETHCTGFLRHGGEEALEARTIAAGLSGSFGRSAWYGGADAVWDARPALVERRFSVQAGRGLAGGAMLLARVEYVERPAAPGALAALGETSIPLAGGARLDLEPRFRLGERSFQDGQLTARVATPLLAGDTRLTGTLAVGAGRDQDFRGVVREGAVALSYSPRARARADFELRRLDEGGAPALESSARYDATVERYDAPAWQAARDTGWVTVVVGRAGNGSGMGDVLVSLDGQSLRFTDADGIARFDHVAPGVHTVAIEERSLDPNAEVLGASRAFVTVESGRVPEPVRFTVGRRERRTEF